VQQYFISNLKERFPKTKIEEGTLAVTVKFKDIEIQLLPAIRYMKAYKIPDPEGKGWSVINPKSFSRRLTRINEAVASKVIPTIKLAKSIISGLPEKFRLSGYHTEALAIEIFKGYKGPITPKAMLTNFFRKAPHYVRNPIRDKTGQSLFVDEYLGSVRNIRRKSIADTLDRIGRRMQNADGARSVIQWRDILEQL